MNWTVGKRMFLIGAIAVLGVGLLAANTFMSNRSVAKSSELVHLRNEQIETINQTVQAQLALMLAAMDSIIDKDEGMIEAERMETINSNVTLIQNNLKLFDKLADTEEEKRLTSELHGMFENLAKKIQVDLKKLIEKSDKESQETIEAFVAMDDALDEDATQIEENLMRMMASVHEEVREAETASKNVLSRSTLIGDVISIATLVILLSALFLISRSIIKPITRVSHGLNEGSDQVAAAAGQVSSSSQALAEADENAVWVETRAPVSRQHPSKRHPRHWKKCPP